MKKNLLKKHQQKNVPVLEVQHKGFIWESNAIGNYFASIGTNKNLRGEGFHASQVDQIIELVSSKGGPIHPLILSAYGVKKITKPELKDAEAAIHYLNTILDNILTHETFLVGNSITLADLLVFSRYRPLFEKVWEPEERVKVPKSILRWFNTISQQEEVIEVLGKIKLKEKVEKKLKVNLI